MIDSKDTWEMSDMIEEKTIQIDGLLEVRDFLRANYWFETKNNFLLFISNNQMYTIPKRFFESGEQVNSFKQLLISELQSRAKLK